MKGENVLWYKKRPINTNHEVLSTVGHSGNSDVDVEVTVDTAPIAYAMLCTLLASKQISSDDFKTSVRRLEGLTRNGRKPSIKELNDVSQVKLYNGN